MTPGSPRRESFPLALSLALVVLAVCFWPSLPAPFERDEGEYAYAADLLARGQLPYRDSFLQKPPGIFLLYYVVHRTLGPGFVSLHLVTLLSYCATLVLVSLAARRLGGARAGTLSAWLAAFGFLVMTYEPFPANTEAFMILPTAAAYFALVRARDVASPRGRLGLAVASGLSFGVAIFFKQVAVFHGPHLVLGWLLLLPARPLRVRALTAFSLAAAAPYLAALLWYRAAGALTPFLECVLWHNIEYATFHPEGPFWYKLGQKLATFGPFDVAFWIAGLLGAIVLGVRRQWWPAFVAGGWLASALLGISSGGYFRGHYWLQGVPPCALSIGLVRGLVIPRAWAGVAAAALFAVLYVLSGSLVIGRPLTQQHLRRYGTLRFYNSPAVAERLQDEARGLAHPTLFVMGSEPQLYHYSGLQAVTRHVLFNPMFGGYPKSRARQEEVLREVTSAMPDFIVISDPPGVPLFSISDFFLYERIVELVRQHYQSLGKTAHQVIGVLPPGTALAQDATPDLYLFRKRSPTAPPPAAADVPDLVDLHRRVIQVPPLVSGGDLPVVQGGTFPSPLVGQSPTSLPPAAR